MKQTSKQLGDVLLEQGLVSAEQLSSASQEESRTGESAWKVLVSRGLLTERDLVRAQAVQLGIEFIDVPRTPPSASVRDAVPAELARRQLVMPVRLEGKALVLAMGEPRNHLAVEEVAKVVGRPVIPAAAYLPDLQKAFDVLYPSDGGTGGNGHGTTDTPGPQAGPEAHDIMSLSPDDLPLRRAQDHAADPVPEVDEEEEKEPNLADFLEAVIEHDASDLHLTAGLPPMIRVHGEMRPVAGFRTLFPRDLQEMVYAILTQKQRETFEEKLELDLSYSLPGRARFRVNVFQQRDSVGAVMRRIPFEIKSVKELGLPPSVAEFAKLRRGLVLVTGITGSGKSTTLAGLIDIVNSERAEHIMTVEDPIEFLHKHKKSIVNQREVGTDTHGFGAALKHVLRQDPDVILVGEMRDLETISTALTAAETGHLVFGTLHTQDAPQSVDRMIDVFPPHQQQQIRVQLAGTLAGIVSQQLIPKVGGGRIAAIEVLVATPAVKNLIREGKTHQIYTSMQAGGKFGMQVMDQHLAELVKKGQVNYEVGIERAHHAEEFNRLVGKG